ICPSHNVFFVCNAHVLPSSKRSEYRLKTGISEPFVKTRQKHVFANSRNLNIFHRKKGDFSFTLPDISI
ncbi:MAG: hypothetical protein KDI39_19080, partial [Pseudomonadales bacterium]|nr:hypothetical protein [Pseudomonadales bacterium]